MATEWEKATPEVIGIAERLIEKYHHHLRDARIGFLFRSEAPVSNGKATLGQASLVNAKWQPFLREPYDFVIWLAFDRWAEMDSRKKQALVDHELCHCTFDRGVPKMRAHDVEEFAVIIQRHGTWTDGLVQMERAINHRLPLDFGDERLGSVTAVEISHVDRNGKVLESVTLN